MTALTRRSFLATTAAGLAATALPAFAAPTTFKHGAFEVTVTIPSGVQPGPATLDDTRGNGQPLPLTIAP